MFADARMPAVQEEDKVRQLPRGRHRLSRDEVVASQRGRMLTAMAEAVAQKGYTRTTVADVLSRARVSRETFYEQFADKEDCFLAAYDFAVEALLGSIADAVGDAPPDPFDRFESALSAYLGEMAREGTLARVFLIEVYGAGPRAVERRVAVLDRFVDAFAEILAPYADRFECEALVAAVSSLVTTRVASGRLDELQALREPLLALAGRLLAAPGDEARADARERLSRAR